VENEEALITAGLGLGKKKKRKTLRKKNLSRRGLIRGSPEKGKGKKLTSDVRPVGREITPSSRPVDGARLNTSKRANDQGARKVQKKLIRKQGRKEGSAARGKKGRVKKACDADERFVHLGGTRAVTGLPKYVQHEKTQQKEREVKRETGESPGKGKKKKRP